MDEISFYNLTYYFKSLNLASINFVGIKAPLNIFEEIKNGNISIEKAEKDQRKFKSNLT